MLRLFRLLQRTTLFAIIIALSVSLGDIQSPAYAALPAANLPTLAPMLEKAIPAVVNIATEQTIRARSRTRRSPFADPFRHFFDQQRNRPPPDSGPQRKGGIGSGVIIDADKGHIVTNNHVIEGADDIYVTLDDGRRYKAEIVGTDEETDVAVISIKADNLTEIKMADSSQARVGDFVVAIGNPFRLSHTVTLGIVSALGRSGLGIESYEDFIQTDASINPGNSGGALVNLKGELLGINTAILGPNQGNIGIGFAIPSNMAKSIVDQLLAYGEVRRGRLGVTIQTLTPDLAKAFGLDQERGVVVTEVLPGSPADGAGLKAGDVILAANDKTIKDSSDMRNHVGLLRVGSKLKLNILRDDQRKVLTATIVERQANRVQGSKLDKRLAGAQFALKSLTQSPKQHIIVVINVARNSPAYRNGLRKNDIVLEVNRRRVSDIDVMAKWIEQGEPLLLSLRRGNKTVFYALRP